MFLFTCSPAKVVPPFACIMEQKHQSLPEKTQALVWFLNRVAITINLMKQRAVIFVLALSGGYWLPSHASGAAVLC